MDDRVTKMTTSGHLVVGGSGYLGAALRARLDGTATYRRHAVPGGVAFDSTTMRLRDAVDLRRFQSATLFLGETNIAACVSEPERTDEINVHGIIRILDDLREAGVKPIFMSSDAVFGGLGGGVYSEDSQPEPSMRYGMQKLQVEAHIQATFDDYLIFRPSKVYDTDPAGNSIPAKWLDDIRHQRMIRCATDHRFCPVLKDDLIEAMALAIGRGLTGLFHAAGPSAVTYWEMFQTFLDAMDIAPDTVEVTMAKINDFSVAGEQRPIDNTMNSDRLYDLVGVERADTAEVFRRFRLRLDTLPGSRLGIVGGGA